MTATPYQIDPRLRSLLAGLRWRIRAYVWLHGLSLALIWVGVTFWAGLAMDYLPVLASASEMPRAARAVVLAIVGAGLAYVLYRWMFRRLLVRLADRSLAVLLERRFRHFQDSLVTSVELTERPDHAETFNPAMLDQTTRDALTEADHVRLREVFNYRPLARSALIAACLLVSVGVFWGLNRQALATWAQRMYLLENQPWPRSALIEVVGVELLGPEDAPASVTEVPLLSFQHRSLKVARGSNLRLRVRADRGAKKVPEVCTLDYRTADGERGRVTINRMKRTRDQYQNYAFSGKPLQGILSTVHFDVIGYDYRVRDYTLEVVDSPAIVSTELECVFPKYMVDEKLSLWLPRTVPLTNATQLPHGTRVTLHARTNKPLQRVDLFNVDTKETATLKIGSPGTRRQEFQYAIDSLRDNVTLDITLHDIDGVLSERPHRIFLPAIPDEPPQVDVRLRGIGTAVTPDVMIPVEGKIVDDYAVAKAWFDAEIVRGAGAAEEAARNEHLTQEFTVGAEGKADGVLDFREVRSRPDGFELKPKDKVTVAIKAADKYDLGGGPNVGNGDRHQLDVVTADTLLALLEARELGLRRRFEQIIQEMTQARDFLARVQTAAKDKGLEPEEAPSAGKDPGDKPLDATKAAERAQSLRLLRVQQSLQQTRKSVQELLGVAVGFHDIREELINNRADTEDRKKRLKELIADPMQLIAEVMFPELERRLLALEKVLLDDLNAKRYDSGSGTPEAEAATVQANEILAELEKILQQMLDLETFNELLDIVRQLIKDQERLIKDTSDEREKGLLEDLQ